jgi:hypothetical protein
MLFDETTTTAAAAAAARRLLAHSATLLHRDQDHGGSGVEAVGL